MPGYGDFDASLQTLLRQTMQHAAAIKTAGITNPDRAIDRIYGFYTGSSKTTGLNLDILASYLDSLYALLSNHGKHVSAQGMGKSFIELRRALKAGNTDDAQDLWLTFYHFLSRSFDPKGIKKRIYIHAADPIELNSIAIMDALVGLLDKPGFEGFQEVKVAGPGDPGRNDTIVAYLDNDAAVAAVLEELKKVDSHVFTNGVPLVVREVMPGVGVADEPPNAHLTRAMGVREQQSFGMFLSKLIWWALEAADVPVTSADVLDKFMIALRIAKIDPLNPHLHADRESIEKMERDVAIAFGKRGK